MTEQAAKQGRSRPRAGTNGAMKPRSAANRLSCRPAWGSRGRGLESRHPDHSLNWGHARGRTETVGRRQGRPDSSMADAPKLRFFWQRVEGRPILAMPLADWDAAVVEPMSKLRLAGALTLLALACVGVDGQVRLRLIPAVVAQGGGGDGSCAHCEILTTFGAECRSSFPWTWGVGPSCPDASSAYSS